MKLDFFFEDRFEKVTEAIGGRYRVAELNLKQIIDRLNAEFTGETRKLVFWYDDKAEFAEDMETVRLQNAKIWS